MTDSVEMKVPADLAEYDRLRMWKVTTGAETAWSIAEDVAGAIAGADEIDFLDDANWFGEEVVVVGLPPEEDVSLYVEHEGDIPDRARHFPRSDADDWPMRVTATAAAWCAAEGDAGHFASTVW